MGQSLRCTTFMGPCYMPQNMVNLNEWRPRTGEQLDYSRDPLCALHKALERVLIIL